MKGVSFSVLECKITNNQGEVVRIIHVVIKQSRRHQYEFLFSLIQVKGLGIEISVDKCIRGGLV